MRVFERQVKTYIAICREIYEDDGTARLSATRLVSLTVIIGALLWLAIALTFGLWILWQALTVLLRYLLAFPSLLTPHLYFLKVTFILTWIGLKSFAWGISPSLIGAT